MIKRDRGSVLVVILVIIIASFFIAGCENLSGLFSKQTASEKKEYFKPKGTVIAQVGDMVITQEELDTYVENRNAQIEAYVDNYKRQFPDIDSQAIIDDLERIGLKKVETLEQKIELLESDLVRQRLLYREALDRRLDKKEDIITALEEFKMNLLVASLLQEETDKIKATSSEIEAYYNQNRDMLREAEERRVREIVTESESQAKAALIEVLQGADFAEVARRYSVSKTASQGGDLGFIGPGTKKFPQFDIAVFSLDVGKVSSTFKNPNANEFYIVKVEDKKGGRERQLSELWDAIKAQLEQDKQREAIDGLASRLRQATKVEINKSQIK